MIGLHLLMCGVALKLSPVCSEHLLGGRAGETPVLVHVTPAVLLGHCTSLCMAARSGLEMLQDALRDIITSCVTSDLKDDLKDWVPSRYKPFYFLSEWKTWQRKFGIKLRIITRLRWPADSKILNTNAVSHNVANQPVTEKYISYKCHQEYFKRT